MVRLLLALSASMFKFTAQAATTVDPKISATVLSRLAGHQASLAALGVPPVGVIATRLSSFAIRKPALDAGPSEGGV